MEKRQDIQAWFLVLDSSTDREKSWRNTYTTCQSVWLSKRRRDKKGIRVSELLKGSHFHSKNQTWKVCCSLETHTAYQTCITEKIVGGGSWTTRNDMREVFGGREGVSHLYWRRMMMMMWGMITREETHTITRSFQENSNEAMKETRGGLDSAREERRRQQQVSRRESVRFCEWTRTGKRRETNERRTRDTEGEEKWPRETREERRNLRCCSDFTGSTSGTESRQTETQTRAEEHFLFLPLRPFDFFVFWWQEGSQGEDQDCEASFFLFWLHHWQSCTWSSQSFSSTPLYLRIPHDMLDNIFFVISAFQVCWCPSSFDIIIVSSLNQHCLYWTYTLKILIISIIWFHNCFCSDTDSLSSWHEEYVMATSSTVSGKSMFIFPFLEWHSFHDTLFMQPLHTTFSLPVCFTRTFCVWVDVVTDRQTDSLCFTCEKTYPISCLEEAIRRVMFPKGRKK